MAGSNGTIQNMYDYYPYGEILRIYGGQQKFLNTGNERDLETDLDYRNARYSDAETGRFLSIDPLAAKFPNWSPFNYTENNPVNKVDPLGLSASPIYDIETGEHLGNDNEGFKGEILFMSKGEFALLGGDGQISHEQAVKNGIKTTEMVNKNPEALTTALTDVVSKTVNIPYGDPTKMLHNGRVSVYDYNFYDSKEIRTNDANRSSSSIASTGRIGEKLRVTYNFYTAGSLWTTVENVQNTFVHEFYGHGIKGWGDASSTHHKVFDLQKSHDSWKNTTTDYKKYINEVAQPYYSQNN